MASFPTIETVLDELNFSAFHQEIEEMSEKKQIKLKNEEYKLLSQFRIKLLDFYEKHKVAIREETMELPQIRKELYQMIKEYKEEIIGTRAKHLKVEVPDEPLGVDIKPIKQRRVPYGSSLRERIIAGDDLKRDAERLPQKYQEMLRREIEEMEEYKKIDIQKVREKRNQQRDSFWKSLSKLGKDYSQKKVAIGDFDAAEEMDIKDVLRQYEGYVIQARRKYIEIAENPGNHANQANDGNVPSEGNKFVPEKEKDLNIDTLYTDAIIQEKIKIPFNKVSNNMTSFFKNYAEKKIERRCRNEGYVRTGSSTVLSYSTGLLNSDSIIYNVIYSVNVCYPYEGMEVECKIKNITKIGIRAIITEHNNPIILFISREHNPDKDFEQYKESQIIKVKILGHRFELNDEYISVIGELLD